MEQKDKELLLKDLCGRLPYGVMVEVKGYGIGKLKGIDNDTILTNEGINYPLEWVKPYLRHMSNMTDEEKKEYYSTQKHIDSTKFTIRTSKSYDWLNKHHFDYHIEDDQTMIERGLALVAPKDMYKQL